MKLRRLKTYTNDVSSLNFKVLAIHHESDEYYKVKGLLLNKFNGIVYEKKNYKLYKNRILNWYEVR